MLKKRICVVLLLLIGSTALMAKKDEYISIKKLKNINKVATIMVGFDRRLSATSGGLLLGIAGEELGEDEKNYYDSFSEEMQAIFKEKVKKEFISVQDNPIYIESSKKPKDSFYITEKFGYFKKSDKKELGKLCKKLDVDAVLLYRIKYGMYKSGTGGVSIGGMNLSPQKKKYRLIAYIVMVNSKGKIVLNKKIKTKYITASTGLDLGLFPGIDTTAEKKENTSFYQDLRDQWFEKYKDSFKG